MQELYICITICLTIIIVFFLLIRYSKKDKNVIINKIKIKNKNLKYDYVYINIHLDGKLSLDYYDESIDDIGL